MKPLQIEVEGFTCFRDKQTVDFRTLGLFAITGPTGAGKSSLLDAMTFALYGLIPRVGRHGVAEFVSLGCDRMSVLFEFAVGPERYRIGRVAFRVGNRGTRVQLERAEGEAWAPLGDAVRDVTEHVERILGLNHDTFQQSVLLPQGQFSRFLKAQPGQQRAILKHLLRLSLWERLHKDAGLRSAEASRSAEGLRQRLEQDYAGVDASSVAAAEHERARLEAAVAETDGVVRAARDTLRDLDQRAAAWRDVRAHERLLAGFLADSGGVQGREAELAAARRAAEVLPSLAAAESARRAWQAAADEVAAKQAEAEAARSAAVEADRTLAEAEAAARAVPELEARIRQLEGAVVLQPGLDELRRRAVAERAEATRAGAAERAARAAAAAAEQRMAELATRAAAFGAEVAGLGYDAAHHTRLRELATAGEQTRRARADVVRAEQSLTAATAGAAAATEALVVAGEEAERAGEAAEQAAVRLRGAVTERQQAERAHQAHVLRESLAAGAPCPVCEQPVHDVPDAASLPALEALRAEEAGALSSVDQAQRAAQEASRHHAGAEARASAASAAVREAEAGALAGRAQLEALERELVGQSGLQAGHEPVEARLAAVLKGLTVKAQAHERAASERDRAQRALAEAQSAHGLAQAEARAARDSADQAQVRAAAIDVEIERWVAQIRAVTTAADPAAEQRTVQAQVAGLRASEATARAASSARAAAAARGDAASDAACAVRAQAHRRREEARSEGAQAVVAAGFTEVAAVEAAARPVEAQRVLERQVAKWHADVAQARARVAAARERAGEVEVTDVVVAERRAKLVEDERRLDEAARALGRAGQIVEEQRRKHAVAERLRGELAGHEVEHGLYERLARDLRTDRFERWLLDGTFRALVDGASVRLFEISGGRYTLAFRGDEFYVVDHDHAGELRKADTLSGGETFLASLCLALQLSEQVQQASGAVRLDSLFVDEGFGTLDPETLDTVAGAIEALSAGDRMVGIITHVAELTRRLPARIEVHKRGTGSTVRVVRA